MRTKGREQVSRFSPDNLVAGNRHPVDVCHIILKKGQKLLRGSLLEKDVSEPGKYVLRGTAAAGAGNGVQDTETGEDTEAAGTGKSGATETEAEYVLAEDADAGEEDMVCQAYRTGEFAENALIVKEGYEITENDRKALRNAGIFLVAIMM